MHRTITHKVGRTIETPLSDARAIDRLRTAGQRGKFVDSIPEQYVTKGRLTDSQWYWVHKIALEKNASSKDSYVTVEGCQAIRDMFARAMARRLKTPKITFQFDDVSIVYYVGRRDRSRNQVAVYKVDGRWNLDVLGLGSITDVSGFNPVSIFELSLDTASDLNTFQSAAFTLATITFNTIGIGTSAVNLTVIDLSDELGNSLSADTVNNGSVTVNTPGGVIPEPATFAVWSILGMCGIGAGYWRRRRKTTA